MILKIGDFPIFYIPYFSQSLEDRSFPFEIVPGKSGEWGYYILSRYRYNLDNQNKGKVSLDWYQDRGMGVGINHKLETKYYGKALIKYYTIQDTLYKLENRSDLFDEYPEERMILTLKMIATRLSFLIIGSLQIGFQ